MAPTRVTESVDVDAPPERVYDLVADPRNYPRWSPESDGARLPGGLPLAAGDSFTGLNSLWLDWSGACTVVVADRGREFAFDVRIAGIPVSRWGFRLAPLEGGRTRVTQTWDDRRTGPLGLLIRPAGLLVGRGASAAERNATTMRATLAALRAELAAPA